MKHDISQRDLFFKPNGEAYARTRDPVTSHTAAESVRGDIANKLESEILSVLKRYPFGLTSHELVTETGLTWNTCTPRIAPLVRKHLVIDSGERRKGPTNRSCIVWKAL